MLQMTGNGFIIEGTIHLPDAAREIVVDHKSLYNLFQERYGIAPAGEYRIIVERIDNSNTVNE